MKTKDPVKQYCWDWVRWCETRHLYIPSRGQGTLAALQLSKGGGREPNARNDPDMQYFNMAVHMLADMAEHQADWVAFQHFYLKPAQVVKRTADQLGVGMRTYYDMVNRFGKRAFRLAPSIKKVHEQNREASPTPIALPPDNDD